MRASAVTFALAAAISQVAAHGYVPQVNVDGKFLPGWDLSHDPYTTPKPLRIVRPTPNDSGFVADPTSKGITCSNVGNSPLPAGAITAQVPAGGKITFLWNTWPVGHVGPIMNYMAKCPGDCSSFAGDSGKPWFKASQLTYTNGVWPTDALAKNNFTHTFTVPSKLAPGNYLIRHELLALHGGQNVGGAQFYPVCLQVTVTGSGSVSPTGNVAFPGTYSSQDPGILFNPYLGDAHNAAYIPPGGSVYSGLS